MERNGPAHRAPHWRLLGVVCVVAGVVAAPLPSFAGPATAASSARVTTTWVPQPTTAAPSYRYAESMSFDPSIKQAVLFGGLDDFGDALDDTWTYDGTNWVPSSPTVSPAARGGAAMAYDPATGRLVLFGGSNPLGDVVYNDTWTFDGVNWTRQHPLTSPPAQTGGPDAADEAMAYDPAIGELVLLGGAAGDETWTYNGVTWTRQFPATSPPSRTGAALAYDPAIGQLVLFGGSGASGYLHDTWTYDGTSWTEQSPAESPPALSTASMDFDAALGEMILLYQNPGFGNALISNATWAYRGSTWSKLSPIISGRGAGPPPGLLPARPG